MSRKGPRKDKKFRPKPSPVDAMLQARQAQRDPARAQVEQRLNGASSPLAPLRHRNGNR
jgi:hypothetical protein